MRTWSHARQNPVHAPRRRSTRRCGRAIRILVRQGELSRLSRRRDRAASNAVSPHVSRERIRREERLHRVE